jgi:hypothetical protein
VGEQITFRLSLFSVIASNAVYCGFCLQSGKMTIVLSNKNIPTRHVDLVQNRRNVICAPEGLAVPVPHMTPVVLLLNDTTII